MFLKICSVLTECDLEYLGNNLGIGDGSLSSSYSYGDTQETSQSSKEAEVCTSSAPGKLIQEANLSSYIYAAFCFAKRPNPASSNAPSLIVVNDEETSQKVTKQSTDPVTQGDKVATDSQGKAKARSKEKTWKSTLRHINMYRTCSWKIINSQAARIGARGGLIQNFASSWDDFTSICSCWEKTGILAIWNVDERAFLAPTAFAEVAPTVFAEVAPTAFAEVARLFCWHEKYDTSCAFDDESC